MGKALDKPRETRGKNNPNETLICTCGGKITRRANSLLRGIVYYLPPACEKCHMFYPLAIKAPRVGRDKLMSIFGGHTK